MISNKIMVNPQTTGFVAMQFLPDVKLYGEMQNLQKNEKGMDLQSLKMLK